MDKKIINKKTNTVAKEQSEFRKRFKQLEFFKSKTIPMRLAAQNWDKDWKTLIAIMMSAQSRDEITIKIAENLFKKFPNLESLSKAKRGDVLFVFRSLNYNKTKSKNVILCAKELLDEFNGKVPHDFEKLISLPGVGRKTANVFLSEFGGSDIGVDTHITYISTKMGWTKNKGQKKIEDDLKKLFPKEYWGSLNSIIVSFGRSYTNRKEKDKLIEQAKKISS